MLALNARFAAVDTQTDGGEACCFWRRCAQPAARRASLDPRGSMAPGEAGATGELAHPNVAAALAAALPSLSPGDG